MALGLLQLWLLCKARIQKHLFSKIFYQAEVPPFRTNPLNVWHLMTLTYNRNKLKEALTSLHSTTSTGRVQSQGLLPSLHNRGLNGKWRSKTLLSKQVHLSTTRHSIQKTKLFLSLKICPWRGIVPQRTRLLETCSGCHYRRKRYQLSLDRRDRKLPILKKSLSMPPLNKRQVRLLLKLKNPNISRKDWLWKLREQSYHSWKWNKASIVSVKRRRKVFGTSNGNSRKIFKEICSLFG